MHTTVPSTPQLSAGPAAPARNQMSAQLYPSCRLRHALRTLLDLVRIHVVIIVVVVVVVVEFDVVDWKAKRRSDA